MVGVWLLLLLMNCLVRGRRVLLHRLNLGLALGRAGVWLLMMRCMGRGRRVLLLGDNPDLVLDGA